MNTHQLAWKVLHAWGRGEDFHIKDRAKEMSSEDLQVIINDTAPVLLGEQPEKDKTIYFKLNEHEMSKDGIADFVTWHRKTETAEERADEIKTDLGWRVKYWREDANLTQSELAEKVGVTQATISQVESGLRCPSDELLKKISFNALGIPYESFIENINNDNLTDLIKKSAPALSAKDKRLILRIISRLKESK